MKKNIKVKSVISIMLMMMLCSSTIFAARIRKSTITQEKETIKQEETKTAATQEKKEETKANATNTISAAEQQAIIAQQQAIIQAQIIAQQIEALKAQGHGVIDTVGFKGWENRNNAWYFLDQNGNPVKNELLDLNNETYYFNNDGIMQTGFVAINNKWYYFNKDGAMQRKKWFQDDKKWYYVNEDGTLQTSDIYIDGVFYSFKQTGEWQENTNEQNVKGISATIEYVSDSKKKNKITAPQEKKKRVEEILLSLPTKLLEKLQSGVKKIYICLEDDDEKITTKSVKDEDNNSIPVDLQYQFSGDTITICGSVDNIALGIADFIDKTYKYQGERPSKSALWQSYCKSAENEEVDSWDWLNSNSYGIVFHGENDEMLFISYAAYYILNPLELSQEANKAYRNMTSIIGQHGTTNNGLD